MRDKDIHEGMRVVVNANGRFYFKGFELSAAPGNTIDILEENTMQNIANYLNIAKIDLINGTKPVNYGVFECANFDPDLKKDDMCVVKSPREGFGIARVVEIIDRTDIQTQLEVVAKVDTEAYDLRVANRAKMAELKAKMKERAKQLQDIALYQMLAKDDTDMAALLNEYQSISEM